MIASSLSHQRCHAVITGPLAAVAAVQVGDLVWSVHGVPVAGIQAEDVASLVCAAPRPFDMVFRRPKVRHHIIMFVTTPPRHHDCHHSIMPACRHVIMAPPPRHHVFRRA
jgi:hypothetical protein